MNMKVLKIFLLALAMSGGYVLGAQDVPQEQYAGMVNVVADPRIEQLLRLRVENNNDGQWVDGYVIQVYYGRVQKATEVKERFRESYPGVDAKIEYDTPDYKVFVGAYRNETEAREALALLKQNPDYSGAFVRPKKIMVFDF